ncbi:MAG: Uma2 family endonuclease [Blastocatellia bacterium]
MSALPKHKYTLEEYFAMVQTAEGRLEFWDGEVFDMSGGSKWHYAVEGNFLAFLKVRLVAKGCTGLPGNTAIKVPSLPPFRYADFSALCGEEIYEKIGGIDVLVNPALIVEVLSDSSEAFDRGDKFSHYKSIPSFREYLLVAQHRPHVSHFIRQADGSWLQYEYNALDKSVELTSVGLQVGLQNIYLGVTFDTPAQHPHLRSPA